MDKDIKIVIYKWLDMKHIMYDQLINEDSVYLYDNGTEYADILIYDGTYLYLKFKFWEDFYDIFKLNHNQFKDILLTWIENTFNFKVKYVSYQSLLPASKLKIPKS